jgi:hypothetical protein
LREETTELNRLLKPLITEIAPGLLGVYGVSYETAARLLVAAGDNPQRLRSEAAWAHMCGVAPIPASSGKTVRHRLNRGGNRQANSALYHVVITRMSHHQPTKDYVARRLAEGKTMAEIARVLKRYVAREVYRHLPRVSPRTIGPTPDPRTPADAHAVRRTICRPRPSTAARIRGIRDLPGACRRVTAPG